MPTHPAASILPTLASVGFDERRHGTFRVAVCDTDFLMNETKAAANPSTKLLAEFAGINLHADDGHGHPTKWHKVSEQARQAG